MASKKTKFREIGSSSLRAEIVDDFQRWQTYLGLDGPIVGAYASEDATQVRALMLHASQLQLVRDVQVPKLMQHISFEFLRNYYALPVRKHVRCVENQQGGFLYARKFFSGAQSGFEEDHPNASHLLEDVLELLVFYEQGNISHGHIVLENIFFNGTSWNLVDFGLHSLLHHRVFPGEKYKDFKAQCFVSDLKNLGNFFLEHGALFQIERKRSLILKMIDGDSATLGSWSNILSEFRMRGGGFQAPSMKKGSADFGRGARPPEQPQLMKTQVLKTQVLRPEDLYVKAVENQARRDSQKVSFSSSSIKNLLICLLLGGVAYFGYQYDWSFVSHPEGSYERLQSDWLSRDKERMLPVALEAISHRDSRSRNLILDALLKDGYGKNVLLDEPLVIGHEPPWGDLIPTEGRKALYTFSLAPLLKGEIENIPDLEKQHVGVLFALVAGLPEGKSRDVSVDILLSKVEELPSPYKDSVLGFLENGWRDDELGRKKFSSLCRILAGRIDLPELQSFFDEGASASETISLLNALSSSLSDTRAEIVWNFLGTRRGESAVIVDWFDESELAKWSEVSDATKLLSVTKYLSDLNLSFVQLSDLLKFPSFEVRERASEQILTNYISDPGIAPLLDVVKKDSLLTREQVVSLLLALSTKGESINAFVDQWFSTRPNVQSVLNLLLSRSLSPEGDTLSIAAARYLRRNREWSIAFDDLTTMALHSEPLARGLAYSRLNPEAKVEREILVKRMAKENVESLKKLLASKLSDR